MTDASDLNLDWDKALEASEGMSDGFEPIPAGSYRVVVTEANPHTFNTGSPGLKMRLAVVGGPYEKRVLFTNFVWKADNPQSLGMFTRKVQAFGLTREWLAAAKPSLQTIANELMGREANATVSIQDYQGRKTNNVDRLNSLAPPTPAAPRPTPAPAAAVAPPAPPAAPAAPPVPPTPPAPPAPPAAPQAADPVTLPPTPPVTADDDSDVDPF